MKIKYYLIKLFNIFWMHELVLLGTKRIHIWFCHFYIR